MDVILSGELYIFYKDNGIGLTDLNFNTENKCVKKCPKEITLLTIV